VVRTCHPEEHLRRRDLLPGVLCSPIGHHDHCAVARMPVEGSVLLVAVGMSERIPGGAEIPAGVVEAGRAHAAAKGDAKYLAEKALAVENAVDDTDS
jgi:hypothetical protein